MKNNASKNTGCRNTQTGQSIQNSRFEEEKTDNKNQQTS